MFCEDLGCNGWGSSWNAILQLGAPQHCLLHAQRPALGAAVLSPRQGLGVVTLRALSLLGSSVPGSVCSLMARGGMCLACATDKHSAQSSFACAGGVPRRAVWAQALPCCVPTMCGWAPGMAVSPAAHGASCCPAPALAASSPSLGHGRVVLALPLLQGVRYNCGTLQQFQVVVLVLCLPANSQGSVDALLQDPSSSSSSAMAGAGHQGRVFCSV